MLSHQDSGSSIQVGKLSIVLQWKNVNAMGSTFCMMYILGCDINIMHGSI